MRSSITWNSCINITYKYIPHKYMLFAGREVRFGKHCARGLKTEGTFFPNTDRPRPANNVFIFFFRRVLCKQLLWWIFSAASFKPGVRSCLTFRKWEIYVTFFCISLFLRSLFTFYVLCSEKKNCWKRRESWKISSGPYAGSGWENPDRWSARN